MRPPALAELALRLLLEPEHRDSVSGDLLEEYRDPARQARGRARADWWYVRQVAGFLWRSAWMWGALFGAVFVARTALDWFDPPADFHLRAAVSTYSAISIFVAAGFLAAWRARSVGAAVLTAGATSLIAAAFSISGVLVMLTMWHDPQTFRAIDGSGGLAEALTLPLVAVVPATVCGFVGGVCGRISRAAHTILR